MEAGALRGLAADDTVKGAVLTAERSFEVVEPVSSEIESTVKPVV